MLNDVGRFGTMGQGTLAGDWRLRWHPDIIRIANEKMVRASMVSINNEQPTFEDLEMLAEASQLLTVVDLNSVLERVMQLASRAVGASKMSLFLHDGTAIDWAHLFTMRDLSGDEEIKVVTRVMNEGFAGWVHRHKRGDVIPDTHADDRWIVFPDDPIQTRSALCVPFIVADEVIAVATLIHEQAHHFTPYHLRLMTILANQTSTAIRNAQLFSNLNHQRQQLQAVLQALRDVLLVLDYEGEIMLINTAAMLLLDVRDQDEAIGRKLSDFLVTDDALGPIVEIINAELRSNAPWTFDTRSERHQTDYQVTMGLWQDPERGSLGYVIVLHDVTTLHDLHRFKDEMLRVASHDLRSPLALIAGYADMVGLDTLDPTSPVHEYVSIIKKSVERMGGLIEDLLRVERIRSSPLELHERIDIGALVRVVIVNARPETEAKNLTFETDLQLHNLPRLVADPVLIRQAMENLVSNAIKYTPAGGTITVQAYSDDAKFHFVVQDTGIGIPEEHQAYVFESFYRVDAITTEQKGHGLGLSLVKNVIVRHKGEVWVKSVNKKGSRFGFWLPLPSPTPEIAE